MKKKKTALASWRALGAMSMFLNAIQCAQVKYSLALETAPPDSPQRSVYFANRAVCHLKLEDHPGAVRDCTAALDVDPGYVKALMRRSAAYEAMDDLERALADAQKVQNDCKQYQPMTPSGCLHRQPLSAS